MSTGGGRSSTGGRPSAAAVADMHTSPPLASTESARSRSPTRCGGTRRPDSAVTPRPGMNATDSAPANHAAASAASRASSSSGSKHRSLRPRRSCSAARRSGSAGSETRALVSGRADASASSSSLSVSAATSGCSVGRSMTKGGKRVPREASLVGRGGLSEGRSSRPALSDSDIDAGATSLLPAADASGRSQAQG